MSKKNTARSALEGERSYYNRWDRRHTTNEEVERFPAIPEQLRSRLAPWFREEP